MIRIVYQWSEDGEREVCNVHRAVTETEIECYHCECKIPGDTPVAKLVNLEGEYLMHQECALKGCALREQRERMREFFKRWRAAREGE